MDLVGSLGQAMSCLVRESVIMLMDRATSTIFELAVATAHAYWVWLTARSEASGRSKKERQGDFRWQT